MPDNVFGIDSDPKDAPSWLQDEAPETTESDTDAAAEGSPDEESAPDVGTTDPTPEQPENAFGIELSPEELQAAQEAREAAEAAGEPVEEPETEEQVVERLYANKYKTPEDLERGYSERSDMWRRALEQARAEEALRLQVEQEKQRYEEAFRQIIPTLEQAAAREQQIHQWAQQYQQATGELPPGYTPPPVQQGSPAMAPNDVQRLMDERLAAERAAMQEQFARQQEAAALSAAVNSFYEEHPEVEPYGALDTEITDAKTYLENSPEWGGVRNPDGSYGIETDPTDPGTLEVLYEAARRPALLEVLKLRPEYFSSVQGLALARRDASLIEGVPATTAPQVQNVPASRAGARAGQKLPFAESAQGVAPEETGPDMNDPWQRVLAAGDGKRTASGKTSIFFQE
jgi:hypothetical protein